MLITIATVNNNVTIIWNATIWINLQTELFNDIDLEECVHTGQRLSLSYKHLIFSFIRNIISSWLKILGIATGGTSEFLKVFLHVEWAFGGQVTNPVCVCISWHLAEVETYNYLIIYIIKLSIGMA